MGKQVDSFFVVTGTKVEKDFSNVKVIESRVIPNVGEDIVFKGETFAVKRKAINYSQVENYGINDEGRGRETIFIFI